MKIGAEYMGSNRCRFTVWSPWAKDIKVKIETSEKKLMQMNKDQDDYWTGEFENITPGTNYLYRINGGIDRSDPASNYQPFDVHTPSQVIDHSVFKWTDHTWEAPPLEDYLIYELHIGTFTPEGTFEATISKINHLKELGITAVEIMPVAQFPGDRNWGYDGVYPFAPQNTYGGPEGLKKLINALHNNHLAVILDVVYNHLGPEGNYLNQYAPYFTNKYQTPWGDSLNFDGEYSDHVRNYFIQNALYWFETFHMDGLRLDAIDKIYDFGAKHFLQELTEAVEIYSQRSGKKKILIAESDLNDSKIIRPFSEGGYGIDAQWCDDFHHSIHSLITGENDGYYIDYGNLETLSDSLQNSFVYNGNYSKFRKRKHGNDVSDLELKKFVINLQNHDQVGNRAFGDRISSLVSFESYKLASALLILAPYTPLIFMGQEFYETAPFLYFISHSDPELIRAVQKGRREEFIHFNWKEDIPDPFSEDTFARSKLQWDEFSDKNHVMFSLYKFLISYRKNNSIYKFGKRQQIQLNQASGLKLLQLHWCADTKNIYLIINFDPETVTTMIDVPAGSWKKVFDTSSEEWLGPGVSCSDNLEGNEQNVTVKRESLVLYEME